MYFLALSTCILRKLAFMFEIISNTVVDKILLSGESYMNN